MKEEINYTEGKALLDHSKKLFVLVEKALHLGVGSSRIPNIFSNFSILLVLLRIICSIVLFSISIDLSSLT